MKLENKKILAAKALNVGLGRIVLNKERLSEIKEAITKQDMKDLNKDGAITVKEIKGKKKVVKRKTRRRAGSIKQKVNTRKQDYVKLTRKLRSYLSELKKQEVITNEKFIQLRKEIRTKAFRSKAHLKERISSE